MKITVFVKRPGSRPFEMNNFAVEMSVEDIIEELRKQLSPKQIWNLLHYQAQVETLIYDVVIGHVDMEYATKRKEELAQIFLSGGLADLVRKYGY